MNVPELQDCCVCLHLPGLSPVPTPSCDKEPVDTAAESKASSEFLQDKCDLFVLPCIAADCRIMSSNFYTSGLLQMA